MNGSEPMGRRVLLTGIAVINKVSIPATLVTFSGRDRRDHRVSFMVRLAVRRQIRRKPSKVGRPRIPPQCHEYGFGVGFRDAYLGKTLTQSSYEHHPLSQHRTPER